MSLLLDWASMITWAMRITSFPSTWEVSGTQLYSAVALSIKEDALNTITSVQFANITGLHTALTNAPEVHCTI